jgi:methylmalonyl-CoA mutase cobalamin-binding domain/chain
MNRAGLGEVRLIAGGIIPDADAAVLKQLPGVAALFGPGTRTQDAVAFIAGLFRDRAAHT